MSPLITKVNNPKVKILMGRVMISMRGRIKRLIVPMTMAEMMAVWRLVMVKPGMT